MKRSARICSVALALAVLLVTCLVPPGAAQDGSERDVAFYVDYTRFELAAGDEIELSVSLQNQGEVAEDIDLGIEAPDGWEVSLTAWATKTAQIRSVHLEPNQEDPSKLTFKSTVPKSAAADEYVITLTATSRDGVVQKSVDVTVVVTEEGAGYTGPPSVKLSSDYTNLKGAPGGNVEFKVDITNQSAEDQTFELSAVLPAHVDVDFIPATDRSKKISAIEIPAGETKTVIVRLAMGQDIATEPYTVTFRAAAEEVSESIDLQVEVQGQGRLLYGTLNEQGERTEIVSTKTTAGKATHVSLYVYNDGTAALQTITFSAPVKPQDWSVEFEPSSVDYLAPGELREIDAKITPKSNAVAGDYRVMVQINNPSGSRGTLDFRIQVETASKWLWYAVIIIVAVLAALLGVFLWMRRR